MTRYFLQLIKHFLFWLLFFAIGRIFFLLTYAGLLSDIATQDIFATFFHALKLDISMVCYLMVVPVLLLTIQCFTATKPLNIALKIYTLLIAFLCSCVILGDICIYGEWSHKLNYKALVYLQRPAEVLQSSTNAQMIFGLLGIVLLTYLSHLLYRKLVLRPFVTPWKRRRWVAAVSWILECGLLLLGMRGGVGEIPISQSDCYFSKHQVLNDAAVNPMWNLLHSWLNFSRLNQGNPFIFMEDSEARSIVQSLYSPTSDSVVRVVKGDNVNVVVILMESWSADLVESLGGRAGITPNFKALEQEGLLFTEMYANGHRSQQGISALISGFPPIPITAITDNIEKYSRLNSLPNDLNDRGYHTSFYFAGDLNYGNLKAYLMSMKFTEIVDDKCFPSSTPRGKLSIFDQESFRRHHDDLNQKQAPFFSVLFTASTHSPYDEPKIVEQLDWDVAELPYLNAAKYTDFCLGEYFDQVKKEPWYENTLFIIVADHSHPTYKNWNFYSRGYQHIPMLWVGGALQDSLRGKQFSELCSTVDLPKTILHQLHLPAENYTWSSDIFAPYSDRFAMVELSTGISWITPHHYLAYNGFDKKILATEGATDSLDVREKQAKAFLQVLFDAYLE